MATDVSNQAHRHARVMRIKLRDDAQAELKKTFASYRQQMAAMNASLEQNIDDLQQDLERAEHHAQHMADKMQRVIEERDLNITDREALSERLQQQQKHIAVLAQQLQAYENSTSWRITAPLRRLIRTLRRS